MNPEKNRRQFKNYWINTTVQTRALAMSLSFICIVMMLTMAAMLLYHRSSLDGTMTGSAYLHIALYGIFGATIFLAAIANIWQSHKFCGALVNFSNVFKVISAGNLTARIGLRKGDFLTEEAELFNQMVEGLVTRITVLDERNQALVCALKKAAPHGVELEVTEQVHI